MPVWNIVWLRWGVYLDEDVFLNSPSDVLPALSSATFARACCIAVHFAAWWQKLHQTGVLLHDCAARCVPHHTSVPVQANDHKQQDWSTVSTQNKIPINCSCHTVTMMWDIQHYKHLCHTQTAQSSFSLHNRTYIFTWRSPLTRLAGWRM